jgi:hypothetical protein
MHQAETIDCGRLWEAAEKKNDKAIFLITFVGRIVWQ